MTKEQILEAMKIENMDHMNSQVFKEICDAATEDFWRQKAAGKFNDPLDDADYCDAVCTTQVVSGRYLKGVTAGITKIINDWTLEANPKWRKEHEEIN